MLKENMAANFDHRFPVTEEILLGTLLDPRLQNLESDSRLTKRNTTKFDFLKSAVLKIVPNVNVGSSLAKSANEVKSKSSKRSLLSKLLEKHAYEPRSTCQNIIADKIDEEIHKYFLTVVPKNEIDDFDLMEFWRNIATSLPFLAEVVKKYYCIPITSTSSEREFSSAGLLITAKRSCLSPLVVEKTLFLHDNYQIIKNAIVEV